MTPRRIYVIARSGRGRPTLQHRVRGYNDSISACGVPIGQWSRAYMVKAIEQVLCKKSGCRE